MGRTKAAEEINFDKKFQIMHFLDSIRWHNYAPCGSENGVGETLDEVGENGSNLINYAHTDMTPDEIILTHWLVYITERQMEFEQIWDKGGFVFSEIVRRYTQEESLDCISPDNCDSLFVKPREDVVDYVFRSAFTVGRGGTLTQGTEACRRLERYYSEKELNGEAPAIEFKSRYYTTDYLYMRYTLSTLCGFDCSISNYLAKAIKAADDSCLEKDERVDRAVLAMAYALYRLTYNSKDGERYYFSHKSDKDGRTFIAAKDLEKFLEDEFDGLAEERTESISRDVFGEHAAENVEKFFKSNSQSAEKYTSMKRLWCALRDYLKSPEYRDIFYRLMKEKLGAEYDDLTEALFDRSDNCKAACRMIELPGDVWNENSIFRRCISKHRSGKLGAVLRERYKTEKLSVGYPEEFDTTFDFVPRMCEKGNCNICPFAALRESPVPTSRGKAQMLCVDDSEKYCPLVLTYCGYYHRCYGRASCELAKWLEID